MEEANVVEEERDITEEFFNACKGLGKGEMVLLDGFSLENAINAIELMEPKMDIGMQKYVKKATVDSLIAEGYFENVSDQEVLTIIDATLSCLVAFLDGSEASQTVITNVLLCEAEKEIPHPVLNAFLKLFSYIPPLIKEIINSAGVACEEDFCSQDVPDFPTKILSEDDFQELVLQATYEANNNESPISRAIEARLLWLNRFIEFCNRFLPEKDDEDFVPDIKAALTIAKIMTHLSSTFERTTSLGLRKQDETGTDLGIEKDGLFGWLRVFTPYLDEELPGPVVINIPNRLEAMKYLRSFSRKMFVSIPFIAKSIVSVEMILDFLRAMSQKDSCVFSRSLFQISIRQSGSGFHGQIPFRDVVLNSISTHAHSPFLRTECSLSKSDECLNLLGEYIATLHAVIDDVFAVFGLNLSRQHEHLLVAIHRIWSTRKAAEDVDAFVEKYRFSAKERRRFVENSRSLMSWVRSIVLRLLINFLDVTLSLGLPSNFELPYFFWLYGEVALQELMNDSGAADDLIAKQLMCRGIYFASLAMIKRGQITFPRANTEQLCYEHRLEHLLELPFVPSFKQYLSRKEEYLKKSNAQELWNNSVINFTRCRDTISQSCPRGMATVCNRNLTAAKLLAVVEDRKASWDFADEFGVFPALVITK